jgi:hypothetical protein
MTVGLMGAIPAAVCSWMSSEKQKKSIASQSFDFIHIPARRLAAPKMMPFAEYGETARMLRHVGFRQERKASAQSEHDRI